MEFDPLFGLVPLPFRFLFAGCVFGTMAYFDWKRNGASATRPKEYLFLIFTTLLAVVHAEIHDAITVRLSPHYFAEGKGLGWRNLHWNVAVLAVKASYWVGLILGMIYLVANNPFRGYPRLPYWYLVRLTGLPIVASIFGAVVLGSLFRVAASTVESPELAMVWGIHNGSYLGSAVGAIIGVVAIVRRRVALKRVGECAVSRQRA